MTVYTEDDYLQLSGIQHFVFCRRQWALIHIEQQWAENLRTVEGNIIHRNVHDSKYNEKRGDLITVRAMPVASPRLGISGECDAAEFMRAKNGVSIYGRDGTYTVIPVEYKRGEPKAGECDKMQLAAQAMCLEDMLCCDIPRGYLYYGETRHRLCVEIDAELREHTERVISQMHDLYQKRHTPKVKRSKACNACSLKDLCLPVLCSRRSAFDYISKMLE